MVSVVVLSNPSHWAWCLYDSDGWRVDQSLVVGGSEVRGVGGMGAATRFGAGRSKIQTVIYEKMINYSILFS